MSQIDSIVANLAVVLEPYKGLVAHSAVYLGIFQIISPALTLNGIRKSKTGSNIPIIPFLFVAIFTVLNLFYSQIRGDEALFNSNLVGFTLAAVYIATYVLLSPSSKRAENLISLASGGAFIAFIYFYIQYENPAKLEQRFESVLTSVLCTFHFVAFLGTLKALGDKNSGHLPLEMVAAGALMSANRVCFGILTKNNFVVVQYFIFVAVNCSQLLCLLIFPREEAKKKSEKKSEKKTKASTTRKSKKE